MSRRVYQVFCGRWEQANILADKGLVLQRLQHYDWKSLRDQYQLTHIYLLGLWDTTGPIVVHEEGGVDIRRFPNRCPSPFAISNHTMVNPLLGTDDDLKELISVLHATQLDVIVDFVPNHTGLTHLWLTTHPEYYKNVSDRAFSGDVVELDYGSAGLREAQTEVMQVIASFGVDGMRCDMAHLIPYDFWQNSIQAIRRRHEGFVFIAEAYTSNVFDLSPLFGLMDVGFDAVYDEPLYRNLVAVSKGSPLEYVTGHMQFVSKTRADHWLHYLSNHDDPCPFLGNDVEIWQQRLFDLPGWQLVYNGTLEGHVGRLAHHYVDLLYGQ